MKTMILENAVSKVELQIQFNKMRQNSKVLEEQRNSAYRIAKVLSKAEQRNLMFAKSKLKDYVKLVQMKESLQLEGAKLVKRMMLSMKGKDKLKAF
mmetsp:Transcript_14855/g.14431  ORF Transcript_14855/g.14431 Transcript_14855/m.14431 type:complete len:96 (+) Transcript_14855:958-1245(+)